ncbi:MAG: hypothetical protein LBR83_10770 [Clostridiales bacterium]|jgi:flagellar basal-body rod modification protein FlgD|nr:hypothetical protein [Clostridiales bacterium]
MASTASDYLWSTIEANRASSDPFDNAITRTPSSELDKDAFLKLMIAQMQYQDPLNPMDDKQFLAQMAQFTSLEQMQNLNKAYSQQQAYSMIGKTVYADYVDPKTEEYVEVSGTVSAVTMKNGEAYLFVDGNDVPLTAVQIVGDYTSDSNQLNEMRNHSYIGKYIQALLMDAEGNVTGYVEGVVDYVKQNGSQSVLVVGNKEVFPGEVATVSDKPMLIGKRVNYATKDADGNAVLVEGAAIENVAVKDGKAYLVIGGKNIPIDKINYVMEALQYVGQQVDYSSVSGAVDSVTVKDGMTYMNVGEKEVSYSQYLESIKE